MRKFASLVALAALLSGHVAAAQSMDPANPSCPVAPNWAANIPQMRFTVQEVNGRRLLLAEGVIDDNLIPRLEAALRDETIQEILLRSPGGNARVGNQAGALIRRSGLPTRIPQGWTCFSACNFLFMGGIARFVDNGGIFMVHMFTHTNDRAALERALQRNASQTVGDIEQDSARLAAEDNMFLIGMGVRPSLLTQVMYQVSAVRQERRCLTQQEVNYYNVATPRWEEEQSAPPQSTARRNSRRN